MNIVVKHGEGISTLINALMEHTCQTVVVQCGYPVGARIVLKENMNDFTGGFSVI